MDARELRRIKYFSAFALFTTYCIFLITVLCVAFALTTADSSIAEAQQVEPTTVILGDSMDSIGTRSATRPLEILPKELLRSEERTELSDALNTMPGVQARFDGSPLLSIRGSQSSARVLALQDGIPLNFSDGVGFNPLFIAKENLEEISVLKGPASSLFGRDAVAGAIEFKSERLKKNKFYLGQGSFNTNQFFVGAPIEVEKVHVQVTAYETHTDGAYPYLVPRQGGTAVRQRNDSETLRATILASRDGEMLRWKTYHLIARQIGSIPDSIDSNFPSPFNNWGEMSALTGQLKLAPSFEIESRTSYKTLTQASDPTSNSLTTSVRQGLSAIVRFSQTRLEVFDDISFENFQATYLQTAQKININEYGAQAQILLENRWTVEPALRASTENGSFSPSLGLSGIGDEDWKYFLNYSEGYSPANITQKYAQYFNFVGNPNLQAEHSTEYDVGIEKPIREYFIHFEAFGRDLQNLIQNTPISSTASTPQNVGRARAYGFEFQGKRSGYFNLGVNFSYLSNKKIDTDGPVLVSPQVQASISLEKKFDDFSIMLQDTQWSSYYDLSFISKQLVTLNGWNTLDLFFRFKIIEDIKGQIALNNLLDQPRELNLGYPQAQASYAFTLIGYL